MTASDAIGTAGQGFSVALSRDGNTAILGGKDDNNSAGAAWVFTRAGGVWSEQAKLVGTGAGGSAQQGYSVALSGGGNLAIVGGVQDSSQGAAWVFTRSNGLWTQQGPKLSLTGGVVVGLAHQGSSVALSADGGDEFFCGYSHYVMFDSVWKQLARVPVQLRAVLSNAVKMLRLMPGRGI